VRSLVLATSFFLATVGGAAFAQPANTPPAHAATQPHDTVQVVDAFMQALANGQLEAARQYMTPDAVVMSNGQVLGARDAYIDGPAKGDAAALKGTQRELLNRGVSADTEIGWVISEKKLRDAKGAHELHLTETVLLAKTPAGWKITGIHWSGRNAG